MIKLGCPKKVKFEQGLKVREFAKWIYSRIQSKQLVRKSSNSSMSRVFEEQRGHWGKQGQRTGDEVREERGANSYRAFIMTSGFTVSEDGSH